MKKIILGIAGEIASGKGTTAKYVSEKYKGGTHRFSTCLRDVAQRMYLEANRENLQKLSTAFRENFSSNILSEVIFNDVRNDKSEVIVIDGIRRFADLDFLGKLDGFKLVYIEADMEKRYERIIQRGENTDDLSKTFEEFKKDHEREAEQQIKQLRERADFIVNNNGTFEDLYGQVDEIIEKCKANS